MISKTDKEIKFKTTFQRSKCYIYNYEETGYFVKDCPFQKKNFKPKKIISKEKKIKKNNNKIELTEEESEDTNDSKIGRDEEIYFIDIQNKFRNEFQRSTNLQQ